MLLQMDQKGDTVVSVQKMLNYMGYPHKTTLAEGGLQFDALKEDGHLGPKTQEVILDFQESEGLLRDGIVGPITMAVLEEAYMSRVLELNAPGTSAVDGMPDRMVFVAVRGDKYMRGYERVFMRSDAAQAYEKVYEEVTAAGGMLAISGGIRSLRVKGSPTRSPLSFHYLGLAVDLYLFSALQNPEDDPYVINRESERQYRVYARCDKEKARKEKLPPFMPLENVISHHDRKKGRRIEGHFLDLTEVFKKNGFSPIPPRPRFETGTSLLTGEWWHFQFDQGLTPQVSTFGRELLRVYSEDTLRDKEPWKYRNHIFKVNWF